MLSPDHERIAGFLNPSVASPGRCWPASSLFLVNTKLGAQEMLITDWSLQFVLCLCSLLWMRLQDPGQCFSDFNMHTSHLGSLFKCFFWFSRFGVGPSILHSQQAITCCCWSATHTVSSKDGNRWPLRVHMQAHTHRHTCRRLRWWSVRQASLPWIAWSFPSFNTHLSWVVLVGGMIVFRGSLLRLLSVVFWSQASMSGGQWWDAHVEESSFHCMRLVPILGLQFPYLCWKSHALSS